MRNVLDEGPNNVLILSRPANPTQWTGYYHGEEEMILEPPPIPAETVTSSAPEPAAEPAIVEVLQAATTTTPAPTGAPEAIAPAVSVQAEREVMV